MYIVLALAIIVALIVAIVAVGLRLKPALFSPFVAPAPAFERVQMPGDLPAPVARFFDIAVGGQMPVIQSAVVSGRGYLRLNGLRFPARYRFTLKAGEGYRHYIETTFFGRPLFKVNEWYLDGHCRMELPVGVIENDAKTDEAANLGLWGETVFMPTAFLTDPRVRWEAVDEHHARLIVPGGDSFAVTFDGESGMVASLEAMRWKTSASAVKTPWRIDARGAWQRVNGVLLPSAWALTWADDAGSWFEASVEEVAFNAEVAEYIRATGP